MKISRIKNNCIVNSKGCWIWQKSCNSAGYGQLTENKVYWLAHRYAYACLNQDLKSADVVRHQCHNTKCCNPNHLILGTHKDNWHDSVAIHRKSAALRRSKWSIQGISYPTLRVAQKSTGISTGALIRHTTNGLFNVTSYRIDCKKANRVPKI